MTSTSFLEVFPSTPASLIPWSWSASRTFLALLMFLSYWAWRRDGRLGTSGRLSELTVYVGVLVLTLVSFCVFAIVPLGRAYFPDLPFGRPGEFIAAALFLAAGLRVAENSSGFHAPQEAERVLAESIDYARQGQLALRGVKVPGLQTSEAVKPVPGPSRRK